MCDHGHILKKLGSSYSKSTKIQFSQSISEVDSWNEKLRKQTWSNEPFLYSNRLDLMKIDEGVNGKIQDKVRQTLNSKA